jgi:hypothetical protein
VNSLYLKDDERCVSAARDDRLMPDGNRCLPVDDWTEILELEVSLRSLQPDPYSVSRGFCFKSRGELLEGEDDGLGLVLIPEGWLLGIELRMIDYETIRFAD